jgi:hypothetical protein
MPEEGPVPRNRNAVSKGSLTNAAEVTDPNAKELSAVTGNLPNVKELSAVTGNLPNVKGLSSVIGIVPNARNAIETVPNVMNVVCQETVTTRARTQSEVIMTKGMTGNETLSNKDSLTRPDESRTYDLAESFVLNGYVYILTIA